MRSVVTIARRLFCDLSMKNKAFLRKVRKYENDIYIHQKASKIDEQRIANFVVDTPKEKIAYQMANKTQYDKELKDFIDKFNVKHKNKITLLDFSTYTTELGDLKDKPIKKEDIQMIKQFQKRRVDQRISEMRAKIQKKRRGQLPKIDPNSIEYQMFGFGADDSMKENQKQARFGQEDELQIEKSNLADEMETTNNQFFEQGPFKIKDDFVILLLNVKSNTKVTTLNRINSYKTLLFMGNGNGVISYAKGRGVNPGESLDRALYLLKKNLIAIPRDTRCTLPLAIKKRFQDYTLYLRPKPGFNAHGHPLIAFMLTLTGIDHAAFNVAHTEKNVYNVLKVFFKAITTNTTPQELAQRQGFKVYRHQFIRPLTYVRTHGPLCSQAKVRAYRDITPRKLRSPFD